MIYQPRTAPIEAVEFTQALAAELFTAKQEKRAAPGWIVNDQGGYMADIASGHVRVAFGDFVVYERDQPVRVMSASEFKALYVVPAQADAVVSEVAGSADVTAPATSATTADEVSGA